MGRERWVRVMAWKPVRWSIVGTTAAGWGYIDFDSREAVTMDEYRDVNGPEFWKVVSEVKRSIQPLRLLVQTTLGAGPWFEDAITFCEDEGPFVFCEDELKTPSDDDVEKVIRKVECGERCLPSIHLLEW
jgi:hypothetical protein